MTQFIDVAALVVTGLMVGAEFSVAAFVHPALYRLQDDAHVPLAAAFARLFGRVMPPWYALTALLALTETILRWHQPGNAPTLLAVSTLLVVLTIPYSLIILVPINNRVAGLSARNLPPDWKIDRKRWDFHHRLRVVMLVTAFALLAAALT